MNCRSSTFTYSFYHPIENSTVTYHIFLYILCIQSFFTYAYIGSTVAYRPVIGAEENLDLEQKIVANTQNVVKIISVLYNTADIIVFPEFALTTTEIMATLPQHIQQFSMVSGNVGSTPCVESDTELTIKNISCAARSSQIYTVFSVVEQNLDNHHLLYIVLDRNGTIIKKCKKNRMYLHNDYNDAKVPCIFDVNTTNSTVKFAILDSIDDFMDLDNDINNVIITHKFRNRLPFHYAPGIQTGIAVRNKVNLLVASVFGDTHDAGGSGIFYFTNTSIVGQFVVNSTSEHEIIIKDIPNERVKKFPNYIKVRPQNGLYVPEYDNVSGTYVTSTGEKSKYICNVSCTFKARTKHNSSTTYKWVTYWQMERFLNKDVLVVHCGLAKTKHPLPWKFTFVQVKAVFVAGSVRHIIPVSINSQLIPTQYTYEESESESSITFSTEGDGDKVIAFGLAMIVKTQCSNTAKVSTGSFLHITLLIILLQPF